MTTSNDIDHITFIGSELVGKKVASAASKNLKPCCIELGGKDPAIILETADLNFFESTFMRSAFQAAGQNCIGKISSLTFFNKNSFNIAIRYRKVHST